jgi:hypothetical protein
MQYAPTQAGPHCTSDKALKQMSRFVPKVYNALVKQPHAPDRLPRQSDNYATTELAHLLLRRRFRSALHDEQRRTRFVRTTAALIAHYARPHYRLWAYAGNGAPALARCATAPCRP